MAAGGVRKGRRGIQRGLNQQKTNPMKIAFFFENVSCFINPCLSPPKPQCTLKILTLILITWPNQHTAPARAATSRNDFSLKQRYLRKDSFLKHTRFNIHADISLSLSLSLSHLSINQTLPPILSLLLKTQLTILHFKLSLSLILTFM